MTVIQQFLKWSKTANVAQRVDAAAALARAYIPGQLSFDDRNALEAALTLLVDDPSPKVRLALSETLSLSRHAPAQVVAALAADQTDVAAPMLARSPLLSDGDLVDLVAGGDDRAQVLIASRPRVSMAVSAALAEVGSAPACVALVRNGGAQIAALSFRRMIERHGDNAALRQAMAREERLPPDCRHLLVLRVGEALSAAPLVQTLMGPARAEKLTRDACVKASIALIDSIDGTEYAALVEHMRLAGDLTSSFLVRAAAHGKVDFLAAAFAALSDQSEKRVRTVLAAGRSAALSALLARIGLKKSAHAPVLIALAFWRDAANGRTTAGTQEVSWQMLQVLDDDETPGAGALKRLLRQVHLEALRANARAEALALAAA